MAAALALSTAVTYGLANYLGPRLARATPMFAVLIIGQFCSLLVVAVLVVAHGNGAPDAAGFGLAVAAGVGNLGGLTFFYLAAATGPFSIVAPIVATSAVLPVIAGVAGGDALTAIKLAGIGLALGGVVVVSRTTASAPSVGASGGVSRTVVLALCSALTTGAFLAVLEPAARRAGTDWTVMISRMTLLVGLVALAVRDRYPARIRSGALALTASRAAILTVPGLLLLAGTIAYTAATQMGELSVVSVISSLHPLVTVGLAMSLDGERLTALRVCGIATALAGVTLLSLN